MCVCRWWIESTSALEQRTAESIERQAAYERELVGLVVAWDLAATGMLMVI